MGHANINHCLFDSDGAKVIDRESNICIKWIKVAICITETTYIMNRYERALAQPPTQKLSEE